MEVRACDERVAHAWRVLGGVLDPEVPAVSVTELGIVRDVIAGAPGEGLEVVVTPTYSGCPATEAIAQDIAEAIVQAGLGPVRVTQRRSPAWTTDWITPEGRAKLRAYGIAPPGACGDTASPATGGASAPIRLVTRVPCPRCDSARTERLSAFGSTACKSLYRCISCREPFEYFKPF
ncbi:MAG TPA: 1,2-phenylacetyl-CoA epoxidase subunit PaaD [Burkholderiaceae bacterium]|nr:1,2-phenylacetyl-CoA epoxidase subunit PaaD [Burkholderiaceae bacterium]